MLRGNQKDVLGNCRNVVQKFKIILLISFYHMSWPRGLFLDKYVEEWIRIDITLWIPYSQDTECIGGKLRRKLSKDPELKKFKEILKPHAKKLGWKIIVGTGIYTIDETKVGGEKITTVGVSLYPKELFISPKTFLENKDKIMSLLLTIRRDFAHEKDVEENFLRSISIKCVGNEENKENYIVFETLSFQDDPFNTSLNYQYRLIDRIEFEKENEELALKLFGKTVEEDIKLIFDEIRELRKTIEEDTELIFDEIREFDFEEGQKLIKNISRLFGIKID